MARKAACLPQGTRISDYVTLGVLTATVPGDLIDGVLADTGRQSRRYRQLPARLMVYYVMALALYAQASYGEVLRCLLEGLRWLRLKGLDHGSGEQVGDHQSPDPARDRPAEGIVRAGCPTAGGTGPGGRLVPRPTSGQPRRHHHLTCPTSRTWSGASGVHRPHAAPAASLRCACSP